LTTTALVVFLRIALRQFQAAVNDRETRVIASLESHVHNLTAEFTTAPPVNGAPPRDARTESRSAT
jgi:hypothetical protein